jgi:pimeloyl-ACP methyl ester carboxylesterase
MSYRSNGSPDGARLLLHVMKRLFLPAFLVLAACHDPEAVAPKTSGVRSSTVAPKTSGVRSCEAETTRAEPSFAGEATIAGADGRPHSLHWIKLDAKAQPARGTLFYLAGGPISHMLYTDLAAGFQRTAFPDLDVVLYDYFGFNCSSPIQDRATLQASFANLTMPAMAHDFIELKRTFVPKDRKAFLMGGSHGAMLGAEIVRDYPAEIEKAILFSGDTESGWLDGGWFRFDRLMTKLDATHPGFAAGLAKVLESAEAGKLVVKKDDKEVIIDRPTFEVGLWMAFSLDSAAQASLPDLVKAAEKGETKWIANVHGVARALLEPTSRTPPPTEASMVTTFHRCNVWFPKSQRKSTPAESTKFFRHASFVGYWDMLCKDFDSLGEYPFAARLPARGSVPVLSWVGDQDTFDPATTRAHWSALTTNLSFQVIEGWSHDFGPTPIAGFAKAADLAKHFLAP